KSNHIHHPPPSSTHDYFSKRPSPHPALHSFPTRRSSDLQASSRHSRPKSESSLSTDQVLVIIGEGEDSFGIAIFGGENRHGRQRSEEHTSELQSRRDLVCRLLLEKKKEEDQPHQGRRSIP